MTKERLSPLKTIPWSEVEEHSTSESLWIVIEDFVYDLTKWSLHHPGGILPLLALAGCNATDQFRIFHPQWVADKKLHVFLIGRIADPRPVPPVVEDYRALDKRLHELNLYETNVWYYAFKFIWSFMFLFISLYLTLGRPELSSHMIGAVSMGLFFQQMAFLGHDFGHNGVSHVREIDAGLFGPILGNLFTGVGINWWKRNHNQHHIMCNSLQHDPDIQHLPFFAIHEAFFRSLFSSYYNRVLKFDGLSKMFVPYQHILYYVIMSLARFNLYAQSVILLTTCKERLYKRNVEMISLIIFFTWFSALTLSLPTWSESVAFLLISHMCAGILHVQITLSHFAMDVVDGRPNSSNFVLEQVATSMDVSTSWYDGWFHGGLQYQVEHHLFPRLPRHNLKIVKPLLESMLKKHDIDVLTVSFYKGNEMVIRTLRETAQKACKFSPKIWESINVQG